MSRSRTSLGLFAVLVLSLTGFTTANLSPPGNEELLRLIRQLGSESFQEREAASRKLAAIGEPAERMLRRALHDPDLEVRRHAADLIDLLVDGRRKKEMAALQGLWVLKATEWMGMKDNEQDPVEDERAKQFLRFRNPVEQRELPDDPAERRTTVAFKGSEFERRQWNVRFGGSEGEIASIKGSYQIEVDRDPKLMRMEWQESGIGEQTHSRYRSYSLRGDSLLMCVSFKNDPTRLPRQFATADDQDIVLMTFQREKK